MSQTETNNTDHVKQSMYNNSRKFFEQDIQRGINTLKDVVEDLEREFKAIQEWDGNNPEDLGRFVSELQHKVEQIPSHCRFSRLSMDVIELIKIKNM